MIIFLMLSFLFSALSYGASHYIDEPTREISELSKKYAIDDEKGKAEDIQKIDVLSKNNPDNVNVTRIYASILSSRGEYDKAIEILSGFNDNNKNASLILQECMLKDRVGKYDALCYENALRLINKSTHNNIDLLTILYLTNSKKFDEEKELYIKETNNLNSVQLFNTDKDTFLKRLYPN